MIDTNLVLVGGETPYLYLVDLSTPSNPQIVDESNLWPNQEEDTRMLTDFFYDSKSSILYACLLSCDDLSRFRYIYDLTNFSNPQVLDSQQVEYKEDWLGLLGKDTLMMVSHDTLYFFDISEPGVLYPITLWFKEPGSGLPINNLDQIIPSGELLYSCGRFWGLQVLDRSNLGNIQEVWAGCVGAGNPLSISTPAQGRFFATAWNSLRGALGGFSIDLYPFSTSPSGEISTSDDISIYMDGGKDLFCENDLLGVSFTNPPLVAFYDVSQLDSIEGLGSAYVEGKPTRIFCDGNEVYVSTEIGMVVVDMSNPTSPEILASARLPGECKDIEEENGIVCVTGENYLQIHSFTGNGLEELSSLDLPTKGLGLYLAGSRLYLSRYEALDIYDINDPTSPSFLGTATEMLEGRNDDVVASGDRVYVASDDEIVAFDVSNSASPTLVGYYVIPNSASWTSGLRQRLRASGSFLYWSTLAYGICVIDPYGEAEAVEEPSAPDDHIELSLSIDPSIGKMNTIRYSLPYACEIELAVYDPVGRKVEILKQGQESAGHHEAAWNASAVASGVYFVRLSASGQSCTERVLIVK